MNLNSTLFELHPTEEDTVRVKGNAPFVCHFIDNDTRKMNRFLVKGAKIGGIKWKIVLDRYDGVSCILKLRFLVETYLNHNTNLRTTIAVKIPTLHGDDLEFHLEGRYEYFGYQHLTLEIPEEQWAWIVPTAFEAYVPFDMYFKIQISFDKIRSWQVSDPCGVRDNSSNMILIVEKKKIFINVNELAFHSKDFDVIRTVLGDLDIDDESRLPKLPLRYLAYDDVMELLKFLAPEKRKVTVKNVEKLLPVAHHLCFEKILEQIRNFLINDQVDWINPCKKYELALKYDMKELKSLVIEQSAWMEMNNYPVIDKNFPEMSEETRTKFLEEKEREILKVEMREKLRFL